MKVTRFDRRRADVVVVGRVWGRRGQTIRLRLLVDTGAEVTAIVPDVLDELGYSAREGEARTKIRSAVAEEPGYLLRVKRFQALGYRFDEFLVHAHDLPEGHELDGLLGWDFLRQFNVELRPGEGRILASAVDEGG